VKHRSISLLLAASAIAAASLFAGQAPFGASTRGIEAATAPPSPPVLPDFSPLPLATPDSSTGGTPSPIIGTHATATPAIILSKPTERPENYSDTSATPSPAPDKRKGIEGVWEVQIQYPNSTEYTHFNLKQNLTALTGVYLDKDKKPFTLAGALDSTNVRIVVTLKDSTTLIFTGQLDGTTDMVGMLTTPTQSIPFTAAYRPKENPMDNINPQPGIGGLGGGVGGGYGH
jgi:hypothetical protein